MKFYLGDKIMMNSMIDVSITLFLLVSIFLCTRLTLRLRNMKKISSEISPFIKRFAEYVNKTEKSVDHFKKATEEGSKILNEKIPQALSLKSDFEVLLEHCEKIADRLDKIIKNVEVVESNLENVSKLYNGKGEEKNSSSLNQYEERYPLLNILRQNNDNQDEKGILNTGFSKIRKEERYEINGNQKYPPRFLSQELENALKGVR